MKPEEASRVSVNYCVRDDELDRLDAMMAAADPGDWRVVDGRVVRYGGKPLEQAGSLALMSASVSFLPRLVHGIRVLETALRTAWADAAANRRELMAARAQYEQDIARAFKGETGPDHEVDLLAEAAVLGCLTPGTLARKLREWAAGTETQAGLYRVDIEHARARAAEGTRIREEVRQQVLREHAEIRELLVELKLTKKQRAEIGARVLVKVADGIVEPPAPLSTPIRIPGHGLSKHPMSSWKQNGRCVCNQSACPNNDTLTQGEP